jgi:hypothetical protein
VGREHIIPRKCRGDRVALGEFRRQRTIPQHEAARYQTAELIVWYFYGVAPCTAGTSVRDRDDATTT